MAEQPPYWKTKPLEAMTRREWEALCDGCGRCCLHKLRDEDTDALAFTSVACRLLDLDSCACSDYANRRRRVPDCVGLTTDGLREIDWLPPSCAYVRIAKGQDLAWWHPLVSGDPETVHRAGVSVRGRAISERHAGPMEHYVVAWPGRMPRPRRPQDPPAPPPLAPAPLAPAALTPAKLAPAAPAATQPIAARPTRKQGNDR